jgi:hypothetical protein
MAENASHYQGHYATPNELNILLQTRVLGTYQPFVSGHNSHNMISWQRRAALELVGPRIGEICRFCAVGWA